MDSLTIDGLELPVQRPESVAALCELVKVQRAKREAVYPVGGRTMLDFGLPPTKPGIAVDMTALDRVIDYPARDMTITVQAGITFAKMQEILAKEGQWLPLDVPDPERMTIGGLIAANVSGPRRYGYGTLRDYVIGISLVTDDGVEVKGGGRVVKNVAGYDLMKLHIGALGTMGVITQVTLKVRPKPESQIVIDVELDTMSIEYAYERLFATKCSPVACLYSRSHYGLNGSLMIGIEGNEKNVVAQQDIFTSEMQGISDDITSQQDAALTNDAYRNTTRRFLSEQFLHVIRYSYQPHDLLRALSLFQGDQSKEDQVHCNLLNGSLMVASPKIILTKMNENMISLRAPTAWKTPERVFGKPTPAFELMRHIKRTIDQDNVFNPGRMFV